ncbi:serine protease SP24D [Ceratitis capitata]|nr:serine protease SP24D [Ceratitis capitata]
MARENCFVKLLLLCAIVAAAAIEDSSDLRPVPRIIGGQVAASGQFPYQVSIRLGGQHICGGALVSESYVLTAAHCVYGVPLKYITVQAGSVNRMEDGVISEVSNVTVHAEYAFNNDIAVVELKKPLEFTDLIQAIPIATLEVPANQSVVISGWGRIREGGPLSPKLMYSRSVMVLSAELCATYEAFSDEGLLCLAKSSGRGFCNGDDGGPAVYRNFLIGIASFTDTSCGSGRPDGYTKVSYYADWLYSVMKKQVPNSKRRVST